MLSQTPLSVEQRQIELAEPLRVAEDVDLGDLPTADRERHNLLNGFPSSIAYPPAAPLTILEPDQAE